MKKLSILTILLISQFSGALYADCTEGDCVNGQGTLTGDGDQYIGEFKDGKFHGQGTYTYSDGSTRHGWWEDDVCKYSCTVNSPIETSSDSLSQPDNKAEGQVKYWQSFHSEMTPQDVADELNRMGLFKNKATVNKMPRKPRYTTKGYNWIPIITKSRIKMRMVHRRKLWLNLNGYLLEGPFFEFDREDKLAEVRFQAVAIPRSSENYRENYQIRVQCDDLSSSAGLQTVEYVSKALMKKYTMIGETLKSIGSEEKSVRIFSDDETRVWLVMDPKFKDCTNKGGSYEYTTKVTLHYSDQQRINKRIIEAREKQTKKEINTL
jgi:hypothetical protein